MNYCSCGCGKEIHPRSRWAKGHNPNKRKDIYDWSNLKVDYEKLGSITKVAKKYGCTHEAVSYQMRKKGIKVRDQRKSIENVKELYEKTKSSNKVAEIVNCSPTTVRVRLWEEGYQLNHDNKCLSSEVGIGRYGERIALKILKGSKDISGMDTTAPYDIEWNGSKIDVKTSRLRKRKHRTDYYSFSTRSDVCDYYLLIALDERHYPIKIWLVPRSEVNNKGITISCKSFSAWKKYELEVDENELGKVVKYAKKIG